MAEKSGAGGLVAEVADVRLASKLAAATGPAARFAAFQAAAFVPEKELLRDSLQTCPQKQALQKKWQFIGNLTPAGKVTN